MPRHSKGPEEEHGTLNWEPGDLDANSSSVAKFVVPLTFGANHLTSLAPRFSFCNGKKLDLTELSIIS